MKLDRLAAPLLATALSACGSTPQHPSTAEGNDKNFDFQVRRNCPTDNNGEATTGAIEISAAWSAECKDTNNNGLIDLIIENRANLLKICHTPTGTTENCNEL